MPDASPIHFKLIFQNPTGQILGAQAIGKGGANRYIDVIATMISLNTFDSKQLSNLKLISN